MLALPTALAMETIEQPTPSKSAEEIAALKAQYESEIEKLKSSVGKVAEKERAAEEKVAEKEREAK